MKPKNYYSKRLCRITKPLRKVKINLSNGGSRFLFTDATDEQIANTINFIKTNSRFDCDINKLVNTLQSLGCKVERYKDDIAEFNI